MSITHHPMEDLLAGFAAGRLDEAERMVVAVHVARCGSCRRFVRALEHLGGEAIEAEADPVPMAAGAFEAACTEIGQRPASPATLASQPRSGDEVEALPRLLRHYPIGRRRWVAPGVSLRPIRLSAAGRSRAFLLKSAPGTRMLEHSHTGTELTCVLRGSFRHLGGRFGPGDFDFGDGAVDHQPVVGDEGPCLALVAMTGELRLNGLLGRLIQPFIRL